MKRTFFSLLFVVLIGILSLPVSFAAFNLPWGIIESIANGFIAPKTGSKEMNTPDGCKKITGAGVSNDYFIPTKTPLEWNSFKSNIPAGITIDSCLPPINGICDNSTPLGCFAGTATSDNGQTSCSTTRTWICAGTNGGTNASCSKQNTACGPTYCSTSISFGIADMSMYGLRTFTADYYPADPSKFTLTFNRSGGDMCTALGYGVFGEGNQSFILPRNGDIIRCSHGHGGGLIKVTPIDECHINIGRKFLNNQIIEICSIAACSYTYSWVASSWGACTKSCGGGKQTRSVVCQRNDGVTVADGNCSGGKPTEIQSCNTSACAPTYTCSEGPIFDYLCDYTWDYLPNGLLNDHIWTFGTMYHYYDCTPSGWVNDGSC